MKRAVAIFSVVMLALSAWVISMSFSLKESIIQYDIGPAAYPRLLCFVLIFLSILLVVLDCIIKKDNQPLKFLTWVNGFHIAVAFAFLAALQTVGFPICAFVVLAIMMKIMGCPKTWQILVFSASASGIIYVIFKMLLKVRLPLGLLEIFF